MKNTFILILLISLSKTDIISEFIEKYDCIDINHENPLLKKVYSYYAG